MRIGELAKATGTKAETIRYYEREGVLPAADRTDSNYRDYTDGHLATLTCENVDQLVQRQLVEVKRKIADLSAMRDELAQLLRSCQSDRIGECRIVESLGRRN